MMSVEMITYGRRGGGGGGGASSRSRRPWKYDVFLNFCGQDNRKDFTDFLFNELVRDGIRTFRDNEELNKGAVLSSQLMEAIEGSRIAIIVFSQNYAFSTWCLTELVKILDCNKNGRMEKVFPVFFKVDPSNVRKQSGIYEEAFKEHEERFKDHEMGKVKTWRTALTEAAEMAGWDQRNVADGHQAELIKKIVGEVLTIVNQTYLDVAEYPIGLNAHIERIGCFLKNGLDVVRIIGIYGSGGIGKTTIAKAIYNHMFERFEGSSFLANVREFSSQHKGLALLQKQLLSDVLKKRDIDIYNEDQGIIIIKERLCCKRVLVVLDDVENTEQFCKLVGRHDWFGPGSRIIITTRDEHLLNRLDVDEKYKVKTLNRNESLQLFSCHAFRQEHPLQDYVQLSNDVIHYAGGLPLALVILGSLLYKRSPIEWESELKKLRKIPNDRILEKLEISYNALDHFNRIIFLDISCYFVGEDKNCVSTILDPCGLGGEAGIKFLTERSLVTIDEYSSLCMHDLIRDMGREIVRKQSPQTPGGRSRLWDDADAIDVLMNLSGTDVVEGLQLNWCGYSEVEQFGPLNIEGFSKMPNMRLLKVDGCVKFKMDGADSLLEQFCCFRKLVWVSWKGFPFEYIPNNFLLGNLVILDMQKSKLKEVWRGTKCLTRLKELNLCHSPYLTRMPDFSGLPNLERLILSGCESLVEVHESIDRLKKLVYLALEHCYRLESLPMLPSSLRHLYASFCIELRRLPSMSNLRHLLMLDLSYSAKLNEIKGLEGLMSAAAVRLHGCVKLKSFVKKRIFKEYISNGIGNVSDHFLLGGNEVPEWFDFQSASHSLSCEVPQLRDMEIEQLVICFFFSQPSNFSICGGLIGEVIIRNESKNSTWFHKNEIPLSNQDERTTWVIKIPYCVLKSIAGYGDIIMVSLQRNIPFGFVHDHDNDEAKKIGVHFFYASAQAHHEILACVR